MKRDMDLIRKIMLSIEATDDQPGLPVLEGYDEVTIGHHVLLLIDAGLIVGHTIDCRDTLAMGFPSYITWQGYEFLDAARNDSIWQSAKDRVAKSGVAVTFEIGRAHV